MTSPQKWTTGQDIAEQPGMAEMPLPSPADDAPTQQDDVSGSKSTSAKSAIDEARAAAHYERKAGSGVASGSPTTESRSDVTTEAPAATRTSTPSQQKLSALMAVKIANDKEIEDARLQLKAEADAASGSPRSKTSPPRCPKSDNKCARKCVRMPFQACAKLPRK